MVLGRQGAFLGVILVFFATPRMAGAVDTDGDGVDDSFDVCCNTPQEVDVDAVGRPVWDLDEDCDADLEDYASVFAVVNLTLFASLTNGFTASLPPAGPCQLANDDCGNPESLGEGSALFENLGATTDGPDEPSTCNFFDYTHVESDVWFCYASTCNGSAVVSLCGSNFDTKLAVYDGCGCPSANPVACSDDDCGLGPESRVTFLAQAGRSYMVRVGGFEGAQGNGLISVFCESDPSHGANACRPGTGSCFVANGTPGCGNTATCNAVCALDGFCCDSEWDAECAELADGIVNGFDTCAAGSGSCLLANGTPGCNEVSCCQDVCVQDPFCCLVDWDENCADQVSPICGLFGACSNGIGSCFSPHATPGCNDEACCNAVCSIDGLCCDGAWDSLCADRAVLECN